MQGSNGSNGSDENKKESKESISLGEPNNPNFLNNATFNTSISPINENPIDNTPHSAENLINDINNDIEPTHYSSDLANISSMNKGSEINSRSRDIQKINFLRKKL